MTCDDPDSARGVPGTAPADGPAAGAAPAADGRPPPPDEEAPDGPYRVDLDIYSGPLDLLLYLIRRSEIDIYDIPIARITEQYLSYVEAIRLLEPVAAGDFLVVAATLMEIKSRMLLPRPSAEDDDEMEDPRSELVRQLLEYKRFKDAAAWLGDQADARAERFGRLDREHPEADPEDQDGPLDVQLWDLVEAFNRLMQATLANLPDTIVDEDVPVRVLTDYILRRLEQEPVLPFTRLFEDQPSRRHVAGMFLALLEMIRLRRIRATQERAFGEIVISLRPPEVAPGPTPSGDVSHASDASGAGDPPDAARLTGD